MTEKMDVIKPIDLTDVEVSVLRELLMQDQDVLLAMKTRDGERKIALFEKLSGFKNG